MPSGDDVPWNLACCGITKATDPQTISAVTIARHALLSALGDQLEMFLGMGLKDPEIVRFYFSRFFAES